MSAESKSDFVFPDPGVPTLPLERLEIDSEQAARYVAEARPFIARIRDWGALEWSLERDYRGVDGEARGHADDSGWRTAVWCRCGSEESGIGSFCVIRSSRSVVKPDDARRS